MDPLYTDFVSLGTDFLGKPFWSWNGDLNKAELLRQVKVLKEMGFGGFFMHSRTGLVTEYLGDEWFELINACADEGQKLGMEAWLYDEDRWPSGTAGGIVTQDPRYRMKFLSCDVVKGEDFEWRHDLVAAFACRLDGVSVFDVVRLGKKTPKAKIAGSDVLQFSVVESDKSSFFNGYTYVDTMNRAATDRFLKLTHERYRKHCGDRLGKSIKGIFTDEPHRGPLMTGFSSNKDRPQWKVPWTPKLFTEFKKAFGYDVRSRLPELFLQPEGRAVSQVKWQYVELLQRLFIENFAKPSQEWCHKHNMILTGHILHEDSLTAQTCMSGSMMRYYEHMDYPGVDILTEGNRCYWVVKQLTSVARQVGRKILLSELYGCTGWQMPFAGHKHVGDWQALFGINVRCHHLSWYTMQGEAKRDYPASIFHQSAWWREYADVERYFGRFGLMLTRGKPCCETLVLNPVESVWCQIYPGWVGGLTAESAAVKQLEKTYAQIFHSLSGAQIDFDYGDEEMIGRLGRVENVPGGPVLWVGEASYKVVIAAGMTTMRSSTVRLLEAFVQAGGKVIFAGPAPAFVDANASDAANELSSRSITTSLDADALVAAHERVVRPVVRVTDASTGKPAGRIFCQVREHEGRKIVMSLNVDRKNPLAGARFEVLADGVVEEWDCMRGTRRRIPATQNDGRLSFTTDFAAGGERLFVIGGPADASIAVRPDMVTVSSVPVPGPYAYHLTEPNVCVLDFAEHRVGEAPWQDAMEILKVDRAVRKSLDIPLRAGDMLQPWFVKQQRPTVRGQVAVRYRFVVRELPRGPIELVMEEPSAFTTHVNGVPITAVTESGWWVDQAFRRFELPATALRLGGNEIVLTTQYHQSSNLEAIYLLGAFGVQADESSATLTQLPERIETGSITTQGLPFYGGPITFLLPTPPAPAAGEQLVLCLRDTGAACVRIQSSEGESQLVCWDPYEADITSMAGKSEHMLVHLIMTRRNTFGPLHQVPLLAAGYSPGSFLTEGDRFTNGYNLLPNGLLHAPVVETRRVSTA